MVRTRIAPSPTGDFHIGHLRTALYNYAWAKKNGGDFIVRVEDTDRTRYVEGATDRFLDVLTDYGLSWDEGPRKGGPYAPYFQSERLDNYKVAALKLIKDGAAYYCFCSEERLEKLRQNQEKAGEIPRYDGLCRNMSTDEAQKRVDAGEKFVIRLKVPDSPEPIKFDDTTMGTIKFFGKDIDDQVLLKSDGFPTYHLAVVVDDHEMKITNVLRGVEWISSTPKQILIYRALGWEADMPKFTHLPVFLDPSGEGKMSKRKGSVSARSFLDNGYLPGAVLNYVMLLGWNPGTEQELFSLKSFERTFDINSINKSNPRFTYEKLNWFNRYYIKKFCRNSVSRKALSEKIKKSFTKMSIDIDTIDIALTVIGHKMTTLAEFDYLYVENKKNIEIKSRTLASRTLVSKNDEEHLASHRTEEETGEATSPGPKASTLASDLDSIILKGGAKDTSGTASDKRPEDINFNLE